MARKRKDENGTGPGIGHNAVPLTDDQRAALTFQHRRSYETLLAAKRKAEADFKNACKLAKADLGPTAVDDIKSMIAYESEEGEAKIKAEIERQMRIARWMALDLGAQSEMFGEDRTPAVDRARAEGKRDGLAGETCRPSYDPSTPQHKSYMEGWHEGQAVLSKGFNRTPIEEAAADAPPAAQIGTEPATYTEH